MNAQPIGSHTIVQGEHGSYVIGVEVGRGGVGVVYEAYDKKTGAPVAVKVLHGERFGLNDAATERMRNEILASTTRLHSPFIVKGIDHGNHAGSEFLVMEWMPGGALAKAIARGDHDIHQAIRWMAQLLKGFTAMREAGYVHRDIKPNNVLLSKDGIAKLSDLGLVRSLSDPAYLTLPGDHIGSLVYISDKQRTNPSAADSGDDFYSLCVVFYELLTRRRYHTRNPDLVRLKPLGVPLEILQLIDRGIQQLEPWSEIYNELCRCISLESETCDDAYEGSLICPARIVLRKKAQLLSELSHTKNRCSKLADLTLMDQVVEAICQGFHECAMLLTDTGIVPAIDFHSDETALYVGTSLSADLRLMVEEVDAYQEYNDRGFGFLVLEQTDAGVKLVFLCGKSLGMGDNHLPSDWQSREIVRIEEQRAWLQQVGRGLALETALAGVEYASRLIKDAREQDGDVGGADG